MQQQTPSSLGPRPSRDSRTKEGPLSLVEGRGLGTRLNAKSKSSRAIIIIIIISHTNINRYKKNMKVRGKKCNEEGTPELIQWPLD